MEKNRWIKRNSLLAGAIFTGMYYVMDKAAKIIADPVDINKNNLYLISNRQEMDRDKTYAATFYEKSVKIIIDKALSFGGLVLLSPLYAVIGLAIYLDDPGPIFFNQVRVGKNKHFFILHKFRTMKTSTPHDTPTHLLENPDIYITRVGRILRKTSLDELPQIWDVFRGKMSVIGPRPALWNQDDLVAEREKYGANNITPGLSGWAQINGRDELDIYSKAVLDGEYTKQLHNGGWNAFYRDIQCLCSTIYRVIRQDGIVEGGDGK